MTTFPPYNLERLGHTTYVAMDAEKLSIWSPASDTEFDQFLEIPLQQITSMTISSTADSQPTDVARIVLEVANDRERLSSLNGAGVDPHQVLMHLYTNEAISFRRDFFNRRPDIYDRISQDANEDGGGLEKQNNLHSSSSNEAIVLQVDSQQHPHFEPAVERHKRDSVETRKNLVQIADVGVDSQLEGPEDDAELEGLMEVGHHFKSSESQIKRNNTMLQHKDTAKKRGSAEQSRKAKTPLYMTQKSSIRRERSLSVGAKARKESDKAKLQADANGDVLLHRKPASEIFEQNVQKLCEDFLADSPTARAVLVLSGGDLKTANEMLEEGIQLEINSDGTHLSEPRGQSSYRPGEIEGEVDSASFTSPDGNNASTPRFNKPKASRKITTTTARRSLRNVVATSHQDNKKMMSGKPNPNEKSAGPKYSLKAKQPLGIAKLSLKSQQEPEVATAPAKGQGELSETNVASPKRQEKSKVHSKAASNDPYDLPGDEEAATSAVARKKKSDITATKAATQAPRKKVRAAVKAAPKTAKRGSKKRQSAPAVLKSTATATRSKRSAAVVASQNLRNLILSDEEAEDRELVGVKKYQSSVLGNGTTSQKNSKFILRGKQTGKGLAPAPPRDTQEDLIHARVDLGPIHDEPESETDLYNASPKSRIQTQNSTGASKTASQARPTFSSKLEDILGDIDDDLVPENNPGSADNSTGKSPQTGLQSHGSDQPQKFCQKKLSKSMDNMNIQRRSQVALGESEDEKLNKTTPTADPGRDLMDTCTAGGVRGDELSQRESSDSSLPQPAVDDESISPTREPILGANAKLPQTQETHADLIFIGQDSSTDEAPVNDGVGKQVESVVKRTDTNNTVDGTLGNCTPNVPVLRKQAALDSTKKRKAAPEAETPLKRRCSDEEAIEAAGGQSLRRSPHLKAIVGEKPKNVKQQSRAIEQKASSSPTRRCPRLEAPVAAVIESPTNIDPVKFLIDDHLTRKVHIVNFGAQGANNQGPSSALRNSADKNTIRPSEPQAALANSTDIKTSKRIRDDDLNKLKPGRPRKRQSISPDENQEVAPIEEGNLQEYSSSLPPRQRPKVRASKTSSQASRVDYNGSPRPLVGAEKIDHFKKATAKLFQQQDDESARAPNSNVIFGRRLRLVSIPKTGPSSPTFVEARYVKHQKMANDVYEGSESKEVVATEKSLADPFLGGPTGRPSGFADRLQAGASKGNPRPEAIRQPLKSRQVVVDTVEQNIANQGFAQETSKRGKQGENSQLRNRTDKMPIYDDQATLVNSEPDLTCGSSEDDTTVPLSERDQNTARKIPFRPHYECLSAVAHRLADVSMSS